MSSDVNGRKASQQELNGRKFSQEVSGRKMSQDAGSGRKFSQEVGSGRRMSQEVGNGRKMSQELNGMEGTEVMAVLNTPASEIFLFNSFCDFCYLENVSQEHWFLLSLINSVCYKIKYHKVVKGDLMSIFAIIFIFTYQVHYLFHFLLVNR